MGIWENSATKDTKLVKSKNNAIRWFGLSTVRLVTHYVIYLIYKTFFGMFDFAILTEVWVVSLLDLGLSIMI